MKLGKTGAKYIRRKIWKANATARIERIASGTIVHPPMRMICITVSDCLTSAEVPRDSANEVPAKRIVNSSTEKTENQMMFLFLKDIVPSFSSLWLRRRRSIRKTFEH